MFTELACKDDGPNITVSNTANDFSHVAFLGLKGANGVIYTCLGSLINKQYVLIAATCRSPEIPIVEVVLGVQNSSKELACTGDYFQTGKVPSMNYVTQFWQILTPSLLCLTTLYLSPDALAYYKEKPLSPLCVYE